MPQVNFLAVLICAIISMIIGGIWYGPLFGNLWMKGMGWNPNDHDFMAKMKKAAGPGYAIQFIGALFMAFVLAHDIWAFNTASPETIGVFGGLQGAFWTWLGFIVPIKIGETLWAKKPFKYVSIDLGYWLVQLLVFGVIISVWR